MIEVTFDPEKKLVRAVMAGLLTLAEVERFADEKDAAVRAMGLATGEFFLLVETRYNVVQSQEVVAEFQRMLLHSVLKAKRIATVRAGALSTLQTRRIAAVTQTTQIFATMDDAHAWLFSRTQPWDTDTGHRVAATG